MGRDTLRQLEDEEVRLKQADRDGKRILSITWGLWIVRLFIQQQKEINKLKGILHERTNVGL